MPVCAIAIEQPDGSFLLGLDPSVTNPSTCAYVVETGSESLIGSLAAMTPNEALVISAASAGVWAVAWGFRLIGKSLNLNERSDHE